MVTSASQFVLRPFEGLPGETDWVALKEIVPAATATARTTAEYGARDVVVSTVLPSGWRALHRADGALLLALQSVGGSGDASRDLAAALLEALEIEPGTAVLPGALPGAGPRLQDVLDLTVPFEVTMQKGYSYWLASDTEVTEELQAAIEDSNESIVPTVKLASVDSAYWVRFGSREYVRWVQPHDEQKVLDGLARLHGRRESGFEDTKLIGYFRASGLVVPVWELARGTEPEEIEAPIAQFLPAFAAALEDDSPLDANARRARAGLVARQVTLR